MLVMGVLLAGAGVSDLLDDPRDAFAAGVSLALSVLCIGCVLIAVAREE